MKINLTKLLYHLPDYRPIGTTGDYGIGDKYYDRTSQEVAYAFKLLDIGKGE